MHGYYGCGGESSRELFMRVNHLEELIEQSAKPRKQAPSAQPVVYEKPAEETVQEITPSLNYGGRVLEKSKPVDENSTITNVLPE
jgi:hypothetical protein